MKNNYLPIAFTMGDPSGIGPEIIAKTIHHENLKFNFLVIGDAFVMQNVFNELKFKFNINKIYII